MQKFSATKTAAPFAKAAALAAVLFVAAGSAPAQAPNAGGSAPNFVPRPQLAVRGLQPAAKKTSPAAASTAAPSPSPSSLLSQPTSSSSVSPYQNSPLSAKTTRTLNLSAGVLFLTGLYFNFSSTKQAARRGALAKSNVYE